MTFKDSWGTEYPDDLAKFVKPKLIIDNSPELKKLSDAITMMATTTDDAILSIHEFIKKTIRVGYVPLTLDIPVMKASEQLEACKFDPKRKSLCHQKTVLETALLRSQNIPTRVATSLCGVHSSRMRLSPLLSIINKVAPWLTSIPLGPHTYPEIYTYKNNKGGWKVKDAWIPEFACKDFKGSCIEEEKKEWRETGEIKDVQNFLTCIKINTSDDFPLWIAAGVNAGVKIRESSQVIDVFDPSRELN